MTYRIDHLQAAATEGDAEAQFELGLACANGRDGMDADLVEAHKWFNLAALSGNAEAQACRADVAEMMTAREIAEAQRRARSLLGIMSVGERIAA